MAISIIGGLRDSLDHEADRDLTLNLDRLYEYMSMRLMEANVNNDVEILDEVYTLLNEIKTAWDAIGEPPLSSPPIAEVDPAFYQKQAV